MDWSRRMRQILRLWARPEAFSGFGCGGQARRRAFHHAAASAQVKARCPIYQGNQGRGPLRVTGLQESTPTPCGPPSTDQDLPRRDRGPGSACVGPGLPVPGRTCHRPACYHLAYVCGTHLHVTSRDRHTARSAHQRESFCVKRLAGASSVVCPCIAVWGWSQQRVIGLRRRRTGLPMMCAEITVCLNAAEGSPRPPACSAAKAGYVGCPMPR
jgi:hypothetical protein